MATGAAIISVISAVVSLAITLSAKQPQVPGMKDSGVKLDRRGRVDPKLVAFGDTIVPMSSVHSNVNNSQSEWLMQMFNICVGPIKSVNQLYCNSVRYFPNSETNKVGWHKAGLSNEFPNVALGVKTGKMVEDAMFLPIIQNSDGEVDASFRGDRCATMSLLAEKWINKGGDNDIRFIHPENKWEALVSGLSVIDPRIDPSCLGKEDVSKRVWGTSYRNPACCVLTYLLDPYFGMDYDIDEINIASFAILANYCDAQGLTFDGFINQDQTKGEIMADFAKSFDGDIYYEDGEICVRARTKSLPVIHIDENVMNKEGFKYSPKGAADYCNVVKIEYINFDNNQSQDSYVIPKNHKLDPVIARDGEVKEKTIKLPFLVDGKNGNLDKVKFYANREYKRAQLVKKTVSFIVNNIDVQLKMNDVFTFSNKALRLENLKFRVTSIKNTMDEKLLETKIEAEEYVDEIYETGEYVDGGSSGNAIPPSNIIYPPRNIVFIQNTGMGVGSGNLQWESVYKGERRSVVEYRKTGATEWVKYGSFLVDSCVISGLQTGVAYDIRIRTQAVIGMSSWAYLNNQMIKRNLVLPAIQNITGDFTTGNLILKWDPVNQPVDNKNNPNSSATNLSEYVAYYRVEISHDTKGNLKKIINASTPEATYTVDENLLNGGSRRLYVSVTAISVFGDEGNVSGQIEFYNEPMGQPSSVLVESQLVNLTVSWLNPSNLVPDYDSTDIWITDTKVAPTAADFVATSDIGSWTAVRQSGKKKGWVYVAHRDVFGHPAIPVYSDPIYYEETTIDDLITGSEFESNFDELEKTVTDNKVLQDKIRQDVDKNKAESDAAFNKNNADIAKAKEDITKNATAIVESNQKIATNTASINTNAQAITGVKGDMATMETRLQAGIDGNKANITKNATTIAATDKNLAEYKTSVSTEFGKTNGNVTQLSNSLSTLDGTVTTLSTKVDANYTDLNNKNTATNARIDTQATAIADQSKALTTLDQKLTARINTNAAGIETNRLAIVDDKKALADFKISVNTEFGKTNGNVTQLSNSLSTLDGTVASLTTEVRSNKTSQDGLNKSMDAAIKSNQVAITDTNKALAQTETRLQAGIDGNKASITQISQAQVGTDGKVSSIWGLKLDAGGKVAGMTLGATPHSSSIDFLADTFRIASSTNGTPVTAFEVRNGTTYIRNVLVGDLTSTNIRTASLSGRELMATSVIRAGTGRTSVTMSGEDPKWRLWAGQDGAEGAPFRVDKDGILYSRGGVFDGTIYARSGEFTGAIIAKSGRIDGPLLLQNGSYISGNIAVDHFISGAGGRFVVQQNGDMSCQYANISGGYFRGTTFVENLQGDVYTKTFYSLPIQKGGFVPGGGDQRNFALFQVNSSTFDRSMFFSRIDVPYAIYDSSGKIDVYYVCEGQSPVWVSNYQSTSGQPHDLVDIRVRLPKGASYVRFFVVSTSRTMLHRAAPCNGTVELSKWSDTNVVASSGV